MNEPGIETVTAFAACHGLGGLTPAEPARMAVLATTIADAAAGLPRGTDIFEEPMPILRVGG